MRPHETSYEHAAVQARLIFLLIELFLAAEVSGFSAQCVREVARKSITRLNGDALMVVANLRLPAAAFRVTSVGLNATIGIWGEAAVAQLLRLKITFTSCFPPSERTLKIISA